ncbi:MAG: RNA 2',3'-cyclic phosphodiesterase [Gammaproteobacteria bacterium]|nr:RNA 2',3'-cyclic phosphodiesterase [Gammaproteobacteria bacterium]
MARLFFALWPPERVRLCVVEAQHRALPPGVRPAPAGNVHMTLVFLGELDAAARACAERAAAAVVVRGFALRLEKVGWWPAFGIVWLAPDALPAALAALQSALTGALGDCGVARETRAYRPHLTLARRARRPRLRRLVQPICWEVEDFHLLESLAGPRGVIYVSRRHWALAPAAPERPT